MTISNWVKQLEILLHKKPVITTATSKDLLTRPRETEDYYAWYADTHLAGGDVDLRIRKLVDRLVSRQRVVVGGVSGEYGLGKTSLLTYIWAQAEKNGILTVPPFKWVKLEEFLAAVAGWASYRLGKVNVEAAAAVEEDFARYSQQSLEALAQQKHEETGIAREQALQLLQDLRRQGQLHLNLTVDDIYDFCEQLQQIAIRAGFKGLLIISDELQETVQALSANETFSTLFELANKGQDRVGSYGFLIGMPANTRQQLLDARADVMDRLAAQGLFVDLTSIYTREFPRDLWAYYAQQLGFSDYQERVVTAETLMALGQLTDPSRRDLGNGPRSVTTAFSCFVRHFQESGQSVDVVTLVDRCLDGTIQLGENSIFKQEVLRILQMESVRGYESTIKVIAAFPEGCPPAVQEQYGLTASDQSEFINLMMGEVIRENVEGLALYDLQPRGRSERDPYYMRQLRRFVNEFQPTGTLARREAMEAFASEILLKLFSRENGDWKWQANSNESPFRYNKKRDVLNGVVIGAFKQEQYRYPVRRYVITITTNAETNPGRPRIDSDGSSVYAGHLVFLLDFDDSRRERPGSIRCIDRDLHQFLIYTNLAWQVGEELVGLSKFVMRKDTTVLLALNALCTLGKDEGIPQGEQQDVRHLMARIIDTLKPVIFSPDMLEVAGLGVKLKSHGELLLRDLLLAVCQERFPQYQTLMRSSQWKNRLKSYLSALENERVGLRIKRGDQDAFGELSGTELKREVAKLFRFNQTGPLETFCLEFPQLVEHDFTQGKFCFKPHPMERQVLSWLQDDPDVERIKIDGSLCPALPGIQIFHRLYQLGYSREECGHIVNLGRARRFFHYYEKDQLIYWKPASLEEWQSDLQAKLEALEVRVDELQLADDCGLGIDLNRFQQVVAAVAAEEEYEDAKRLLNAELSRVNGRMRQVMQNQVDRAHTELKQLTNSLKQRKSDLPQHQRRFNDSKRLWAQPLGRLLQVLMDEFNSLVDENEKLEQRLLPCLSPVDTPQFASSEGVTLFGERVVEADDIQKKVRKLAGRFETWRQRVNLLDQWRQAHEKGDQLEGQMKRLGHRWPDAEERFRRSLSVIEQAMCEGLATTEFEALGKVGNLLLDMNRLEREIQEFADRQRREFNQLRSELQTYLSQLGRQEPLDDRFDERDMAGSMQALLQQAQSLFQMAINSWQTRIRRQTIDLNYCVRVLDAKLDDVRSTLDGLDNANVQCSMLASLTVGEMDARARACSLDVVTKVNNAVNKAELLVRHLKQPQPFTDDEAALVDSMGSGPESLHALILRQAEREDGKMDLDVVLGQILSLFKKNLLDISVQRRRVDGGGS